MAKGFKIERSSPNDPNYHAPGIPKYPWAELKVGHEFTVNVENPESIDSLRVSLYTNGKAWFKRNQQIEVKFQILKLDNDKSIKVKRTA